MTTKQIVIAFAVLVLIAFVIGLAKDTPKKSDTPIAVTPTQEPRDLCYYHSEKTDRGFYDRAWIRLNIDGDNVTGEFNNYPAEKDSKVGTFVGTVGGLDQQSMSRTATLIWNTRAEGMQAKEELLISFGDGAAQAAFGEMVQGANGVYVYKDKTAVVYQGDLSQIDCAQLDEITAVEAYVRTNIGTITKDKAVLGGTWYVTSVVTNPATNTADLAYEDGHITGKGTLTYTFENNKVIVVSFVKAK